jgi:hypothetical protein
MNVTVDFEAFAPEMIDEWHLAMDRWAEISHALNIRTTFFVSVEDAARLRGQAPEAYDKLLAGLATLHESGSSVHPHNHRMFELETGRQLTPPDVPKRVPGYAKQASLFYDVCRRHQACFADWFGTALRSFETLCADAGIPVPERLAFRPGGWDCGSTAEEQRGYLRAVTDAGVVLHSGDSHGTYGTRGYHIDSRFGQNVYPLADSGLVELAPCWVLHCGAGMRSPQFAGSAARLLSQPVIRDRQAPGAFVTVLHFDHLFHRGWRNTFQPFTVRSPRQIRSRVERVLSLLHRLSQSLALEPDLLEHASLPAAALSKPAPPIDAPVERLSTGAR